jgi:hypothetical protein
MAKFTAMKTDNRKSGSINRTMKGHGGTQGKGTASSSFLAQTPKSGGKVIR